MTTRFSQLQVHVPLHYLKRNLPIFLEKELNPEIYLNYQALRRCSPKEIDLLAGTLLRHGRRITIHGPFFDLSPGAVDPDFRTLTLEKMEATLSVTRPFAPASIVFHSGYDPLRFGEQSEIWLKNSLWSWKKLLPQAAELPSTWLLIENIFEKRPDTLLDLFRDLPSPPFGFCFDTGHFQLFSEVPLAKWLDLLGPYLQEVHLHDNHGQRDEHLPPGEGIFDFGTLFSFLADRIQPPIGTIEAHNAQDLWKGLAFLKSQEIIYR